MKRRDVLKSLGTAPLALAAGVPLLPGEAQAQIATGVKGFSQPGIEVAEQGLYHLPRDHAWHGGPTYHNNDFEEWHYFTFQGTDKKTGHYVTVFWCTFQMGWSKELNRPVMITLFAWHDTVTGEFINTTLSPTGKFVSSGSGEPNFGFQYSLNDDDGKGAAWGYDYAAERWNFKSFATDKSKIIGKPHSVEVTGVVKAPGYVPMAYWGLESMGFQKLYNQNPETMYGLSYYYTAPEMQMKGTVTLAGGVHEIEGVAWFEHQWGNFRSTECVRYFWGYARFDNGDSMTWRQYYGDRSDGKPNKASPEHTHWSEPHPEVSRFAFIPKGQAPQYSFGPSFLFTPIKYWISPASGAEFPWWGEMKTPKGIFYLTPTHPAQESIGGPGPLIEGATLIRKDLIDGPIVARGFCELAQNPGRGAAANRGLPERTDLQFNGGLKRK